MIHFHDWEYIGLVPGYCWYLGIVGGIKIECEVKVKQCTKCKKKRVVK